MPFLLDSTVANLRKIALVSTSVLLITGCINPVKQQQQQLAGAWRISSIDGVVIKHVGPAKMLFSAEGKVTGNNGCNKFIGSYQPVGDHLNLSSLGTTRMACGGYADTVERAFNQAVAKVEHFLVKGNELFLTNEQDVAVISLIAE
ncbi:MAG: hypothetical protein OFPII_35190 [Osedax symbiont Rs1]|nr:MAG: hypothetical protein OFPII_35190 [Osedax symbiont Rs1]